MKTMLLSNVVGLCILLGGITKNIHAADLPSAAEGGERKPAARSVPFHGKIELMDKASKSIRVGTRTFHVVDDTRIMKGGKPASLEDAGLGEQVGGLYREGDAGRLELLSLRIGPKPPRESAARKDAKDNKDVKDVKEVKENKE